MLTALLHHPAPSRTGLKITSLNNIESISYFIWHLSDPSQLKVEIGFKNENMSDVEHSRRLPPPSGSPHWWGSWQPDTKHGMIGKSPKYICDKQDFLWCWRPNWYLQYVDTVNIQNSSSLIPHCFLFNLRVRSVQEYSFWVEFYSTQKLYYLMFYCDLIWERTSDRIKQLDGHLMIL